MMGQESSQSSLALRIASALFLAGVATVGLVSVRPLPGPTLSDYFFLAAAAIGAISAVSDSREQGALVSIPWGAVAGSYLLVLGVVVASFSSGDPISSLLVAMRLAAVTLLLPFLYGLLRIGPRYLQFVALAASFGMLAHAFGVTAQLNGWAIPFLGDHIFGRFESFTRHPNDLGASTAAGVPLVAAMAFSSSRRLRVYGVVATLCALFVLFASGSVSSIASGALGLTVAYVGVHWAAYRRTLRFLLILAALGVTLLLVGATARPIDPVAQDLGFKPPSERVAEVFQASGTADSRWHLLSSAWKKIESRPLIGHGMAEGDVVLEGSFQPHNSVLLVWLGGGVLGLVGLVTLYWIGFSRSVLLARRGAHWTHRGLLGATVSSLGLSAFQPFLFKRYALIYILIAIAESASPLANRVGSIGPSAHIVHRPPKTR